MGSSIRYYLSSVPGETENLGKIRVQQSAMLSNQCLLPENTGGGLVKMKTPGPHNLHRGVGRNRVGLEILHFQRASEDASFWVKFA